MDNWQVATYTDTRNDVTHNSGVIDIRSREAFRCDFCDLPLKTDLDVSKHLVSQLHLRKLDEFLALQDPQDKVVQKVLPRNLDQVYEKLKVRSVRDLIELADKNYFKLPSNNAQICGVAKELSKVLLKNMARYELTHCKQSHPEEYIDGVIDLLLKPRDRGPLYKGPQKDSTGAQQRSDNLEDATNENLTSGGRQKVAAPVIANEQPSISSRFQESPVKESTRIRPTTSQSQDKTPKTIPSNATKFRHQVNPSNRPAEDSVAQSEQRDARTEGRKTPSIPNKSNITSTSHDKPEPRIDSTYRPLLAKVKVEPKG